VSPSAAILDRQSVQTTEAGGPRGFDSGTLVKGRKRLHWEKVCDRKADANRARREWLTQHDAGTAADPGRATVADALNIWLASHGPGLAPSTYKGYADTLRVHVLNAPIARVPLRTLTATHIQEWYNTLTVGARTGELIHLRLCQALDLAVKQRRLAHKTMRGTVRYPAQYHAAA